MREFEPVILLVRKVMLRNAEGLIEPYELYTPRGCRKPTGENLSLFIQH